jgi:hypothetical protein
MIPLTLHTTLCEARDALHTLRQSVRDRGHIETMFEIDCLLGLAEDKAVSSIKAIDADRQQKVRGT